MTEHIEKMTAAEMLKRARTIGRRKRELPTIAKQLCIKEEYLEALEAGEYNKIPELVYILGFARNYAIELELDPKVITDKIKDEMGIKTVEENLPIVKKPAAPAKRKRLRESAERAGKILHKNWKWASAILGSVLLIILVVWGISAIVSHSKTNGAQVVQAGMPLPEFNLPVKDQFGTENRATANVVIQATSESWVKIEDAQGETVFSRVMVPGEIYFVPSGNVKGTFGNAGGIDVWANGQIAPKLGALHARKEKVSLTVESLTELKTEN